VDNPLGEYLKARRAQVRPERDPSANSGRRRVPGLRRGELAARAGVSEHYLVRLEQGRDRHPSDQVLTALGRALQLDADGLDHLRKLASPASSAAGPSSETLAPGMQELLDAWSGVPAYVRGRHFDVLASNPLARALVPAHRPGRNLLRDVFLDPRTRAWYANWPEVARSAVGALRAATADSTPELRALIASLSRDSPEFRELWARHDVVPTRDEPKIFRHPIAGEFSLHRHVLHVADAPGQVLIAYRAEPGTPGAAALAALAASAT
jgi:transcriptional regulator with XRE-family HTH domain